jgi:hypothetical protein
VSDDKADVRPLSEIGSQEGRRAWAALLEQLEPTLVALTVAPGFQAQDAEPPSAAGIYLFADADGKPVYFGISRDLKRRIGEHWKPNSLENKAPFAFNIAKREAAGAGVQIAGFTRSRLTASPDFNDHFVAAKALVSEMTVRWVQADDPALLRVMEIYGTYVLGTHDFNSFRTH